MLLRAPGQALAALAILAALFGLLAGSAGQAAGRAVATALAMAAEPLLGWLGLALIRTGTELRDPVAGWAVRVGEVCDGLGLIAALATALLLAPGGGGGRARVGQMLKGLLLGGLAIQGFNLLRVLALTLAQARWQPGFALLHEWAFPLATVFVIAAFLLPARRLAALGGLTAVLALLWYPVAEAASALLVPVVNALLEHAAPVAVGEIGERGGAWSVGSWLLAGTDPVRLYRAPLELTAYSLSVPVILAAVILARRPAWLLLALPLIAAAMALGAVAAILTLAAANMPVSVLIPDPGGSGAFLAVPFEADRYGLATARLLLDACLYLALLVLPLLILQRRGGMRQGA